MEILGQTGNDYLAGADESDQLCGGSGIDQLYGRDGNDDLDGWTYDDILRAEWGDYDQSWGYDSADDIVDLEGEYDYIYGEGGNEFCTRDCDVAYSAWNCGGQAYDGWYRPSPPPGWNPTNCNNYVDYCDSSYCP